MGYPDPFTKGIPPRKDLAGDQPASGSSEKVCLIGRFLDEYCESEETRRAYRTDLADFFEGEISPKEAGQVELSDIRRFLREKAEDVKFGTLRRRASTLSIFFQWLKGEELVEVSPLADGPGPKALATRAENHAGEEAAPSDETPSSGEAGLGTTDASDSEELGAPEPEDGEKGRPSEGQSSGEQFSEEEPSGEDMIEEKGPQEGLPEEGPAEEKKGPEEESFPAVENPLLGRGSLAGREAQADVNSTGQEAPGGEDVPERKGSEWEDVQDSEESMAESDDSRAVPLGEKWESGGGEPGKTNSEETHSEDEGSPQEGTRLGLAEPAGDSDPSGFSSGLLSALSFLGEGPPAGLFPEDFLQVPTWAEASVKLRVAHAFRFGHEAFEEGTKAKLQSLPGVIAQGLSLLSDRERFPEGAIQKPYYVLMAPSGEWIVTVWRAGEEGGSGGSLTRPMASGLATRLTMAKPLMDAKGRMDEEGTAPSAHGEAARLLWLIYGRGWTLTGPFYDLLEEAIGLPFGRAEGEPERAPTKRFGAAGTKGAREEVALEVTTLLAKGLGLEKSDEVKIDRTSL